MRSQNLVRMTNLWLSLIHILSEIINNMNYTQKGQVSLFAPPMSCTLMHITESTVLSPLIDVLGNVYLCQMSLYKQIFCLGNVNDNSLYDILSDQNIIQTADRIKKSVICSKPCSVKLLCSGGCKSVCVKDGGDRYCELRKMCLLKNIKIKTYQCWG